MCDACDVIDSRVTQGQTTVGKQSVAKIEKDRVLAVLHGSTSLTQSYFLHKNRKRHTNIYVDVEVSPNRVAVSAVTCVEIFRTRMLAAAAAPSLVLPLLLKPPVTQLN